MIYIALDFFGIHDPSDTLVMAIAMIIMGLLLGGVFFGWLGAITRSERKRESETHLRRTFYHHGWLEHHLKKAEGIIGAAATYLAEHAEAKDGIARPQKGYALGAEELEIWAYDEAARAGTEVKVALPLTAFNHGKDWKAVIRTELRSKREPEPEVVMAARGMGA